MKSFVITFSFLFVLLTPLSAISDISEPVPPSISEPSVLDPFVSSATSDNSQIQKFSVTLDITHLSNVSGILILPQTVFLTVTNHSSNAINIDSFSLADLNEISIIKWKPELVKNNLYRFIPIKFDLKISNQTYHYTGRIKSLDELKIKRDGKIEKYFTLFFDRWVKGQKTLFHWQNSKTERFDYPLTNPIDGVVDVIQFR